MTTLDDFFAKPIDALHPRLHNWKERIAAGEAVKVEVYRSGPDIGQALGGDELALYPGRKTTALGDSAME